MIILILVANTKLDVETTGRQAEALKREIDELMVEDKTMSMTEIKVFKGTVQTRKRPRESQGNISQSVKL